MNIDVTFYGMSLDVNVSHEKLRYYKDLIVIDCVLMNDYCFL